MERATEERKEIIRMGDANICANKWNDPQYKSLRVASELKSGLEENELRSIYLGNTYLAENTKQSGKISESALDHIYLSKK